MQVCVQPHVEPTCSHAISVRVCDGGVRAGGGWTASSVQPPWIQILGSKKSSSLTRSVSRDIGTLTVTLSSRLVTAGYPTRRFLSADRFVLVYR